MSDSVTPSDPLLTVAADLPRAENSLEQLARAVHAPSEPDPDWSPGSVLTYHRKPVGRGRGRPEGSAGLGIAAICVAGIAAAANFFAGLVGAVNDRADVIGGAILLAIAGVILGTVARRYQASRRLGTMARWIASAFPVLLVLPVALFSVLRNPIGMLMILFIAGMMQAAVILFCTLVLDAVFGAE